jgi:hypothetical protein
MNNTLEYRAFGMEDVKVDKEKKTIVGRAVVYNSMSGELRTVSGDTFREIILPGALVESLKNNDILAFKEHDPAMLLGRSSAGTLRMMDKEDGLYVEIDLPDTSYGKDTLVSAERGDLKGFSFGFNKPKSKNYSRSGVKIREISSLNLREVSVVSSPAYGETTLALRNEDFIEEETVVDLNTERGTEVRVEDKKIENIKVEPAAPVAPVVDANKMKDLELRWKLLTLKEQDKNLRGTTSCLV